jgi:hypothetical protein
MLLQRNWVLESESEKGETDSGLTIDNLNLVHLQSVGLQGVEGCFDLKPPHGEDHSFPLASSKCKIMIICLKKANKCGVPQKRNQEKI